MQIGVLFCNCISFCAALRSVRDPDPAAGAGPAARDRAGGAAGQAHHQRVAAPPLQLPRDTHTAKLFSYTAFTTMERYKLLFCLGLESSPRHLYVDGRQ